ncbi:hypothetical protein EDC04DRAFT_2597986 [Pisolithus marmoratus]|nr:hypothetical protein EDC04DRAFT_2597986 [Pisolithus marmoratus]
MATSKPKMRTTAGLPVESVSQPSPARSQAKHTRKCHQESQDGSGSEAIHWEPYPQLMRDLLAWILQHPADCAVLFNETIDQNTQGKPHSWRKKEINAVIADAIFHEDRQYGESYASQPARFASAVASHLVILKNKYQQHASRFKSTGEGINPNNLNYQNLHKQVLVEFPFWEECNQLWHGNPTYDARVFNATPGANQMGNFLAIIKSSGTTAPPVCNKSQVQEQGDPVGGPGSSMNTNWDPNPNILMDASELEEEEEEEGEADESQRGIGIWCQFQSQFQSTVVTGVILCWSMSNLAIICHPNPRQASKCNTSLYSIIRQPICFLHGPISKAANLHICYIIYTKQQYSVHQH